MIIKRKRIETLEVKQYIENEVVMFYEDDYYIKDTYNKVVKITHLLPKGKWFLFDLTRVYQIDSDEDIFDIVDGNRNNGYSYEIAECENVALFLDEHIGSGEFIDFICENLDEYRNTPLKKFLNIIAAKHNGMICDDGTIIVLDKK